jgi:hypothetical protein
MKKSDALRLQTVDSKDFAPIISAIDPSQATRLPIGIELIADPHIRSIPARGTVSTAWQGVLFHGADDSYPVSPRVLLGYAWKDKKFQKVVEGTKLPNKSVQDMLKDGLKVKVTGYTEVMVDEYQKDTQRARSMPVFEAV